MREIEWTENSEKQDSVPVLIRRVSLGGQAVGKFTSCEDY